MGIVDGGVLAAEGAAEVMMVPPPGERILARDPLVERLSGTAERQLRRRGRKVWDRIPLREEGGEPTVSVESRDLPTVGPEVDEVEMLPAAGVVRPDEGSLISHMASAPGSVREVGPLEELAEGTGLAVEREALPVGLESLAVEVVASVEGPVKEVPLRREPGREVPVPWVPVVPVRVVPAGLLLVRE